MKNLCLFLLTISMAQLGYANDSVLKPYKSCSDKVVSYIIKTFHLQKEFTSGDTDCLIIDHRQVLVASSQSRTNKQPYQNYDVVIRLIDWDKDKILQTIKRKSPLNAQYKGEFKNIYFDKARFTTLANTQVIGLRNHWRDWKFEDNNTEHEYLDLIQVPNNGQVRFVLYDLPMLERFYAQGECPDNQTKWGSDITGIIIINSKVTNQLQNLTLKQNYNANWAEDGCKQRTNTIQNSVPIRFNGTEYQYDKDAVQVIDVI